MVVVPIGGGGLVAGIAIALRAVRPEGGRGAVGVRAAHRRRATICDGIAVKQPGRADGPLLDEQLDEIVEVSDEDIAQAIVLLLERSKLVVEGAGALGWRRCWTGGRRYRTGRGGPLGGNIDASTWSR